MIEVGLDELFRFGSEDEDEDEDEDADAGSESDYAQPVDDEDDAEPDAVEQWRADEPEPAGASFGAAFFGWLVAGSSAVLLVALVSAVGALIGWDKVASWSESRAGGGWVYVGAWIVLVVSTGVGAFLGGYTSGRMVPSQGGRQGLDVWVFSWCASVLILGLGYVADRQYHLAAGVDWPSLPIAEADRTVAVLVALAALLLVTLVGSVLGGAVGNRCYSRLSKTNKSSN
ncbi:hypothetical protein [Kribbella shirazensis]|uniref:Uncharacterized protein n=1 Tax=Kribbella shirazensis TaxID=1105143 RepID=A0A7X5VC01_9ACTN|nr:hypothetical protein [Kribbella shirazensis]NIK58420.1 hypothetical protein [Kribbella shirazensis]